VLEASVTAHDLRKQPNRNLAAAFVHSARRHWRRTAISDSSGKRLSFGRTLAGGIALARLLEPRLRGQEHVGILLPASVGGALANIAVSLTGRVSVNLNFTASREALAHALAQSQIRTVLSARAFLEKMPTLEAPPGVVYLEDLLPQIGTGRRLAALALAALAPARALMTHRRSGPDDLATIIFSSGSTGQPKGVMLTHHNILSNIESFGSVFGFTHEDRMCAALPLFHSFGFTTTLWCPLILGFSACFHPNPLDATAIAALVRRERLTVLLATPTFLLGYLRRATREDFASLRCAVTGAEKLKPRLADAFLERFGIRPQEGYGTTELSPAVGVSLPDVAHDGVTQAGSKPGSIGHPIPGVAIRIVDPDTRQPLAPGQEGLVLVKGPNVMRGYLNEPALTAEAVEDGWYNTGDIGRLDEDGFLFLVDRLARFSKIGGEMVPHVLIEERLMESVQPPMGSLAVTSIPDDRKGEQLVVLYTAEAGDVGRMRDAVRQSDLPNLWKPRDDCFMRIDALPLLGSGKLDLRAIRDLAKRQAAERTETTNPTGADAPRMDADGR
jgi:acyl-[acyl-carrier-protein]-phospholipid O-acyltransferase/long-chain-fatty-acid--[acyl-carrier-protein] ligase